jgi:3-dehydroquinate dehydratase/shikimate dehydrogenase
MSKPLLCITVSGRTMEELRLARDAAAGADLVELRLDGVANPDVAGAIAGRRVPVIVTCRPIWEGGRFDGSEEERRRLLGEALRIGADYVDLEARAGFDDLLRDFDGRRIVLSLHEFKTPQLDLQDRVRAMAASRAAVIKVAVEADRLSDTLPLLALGRELTGRRIVLIAMGPAGLPTRILAAHYGSCWTYGGGERSVGQPAPSRLLDELRFREVTSSTDVYGIVGRPVNHSVSPAMHNAAFRSLGVDAVYVPLAASDAADFITFADTFGLRGASVTAPFKQALLARLDETDDISARVHAVNTIRIDGCRWSGRNTDVAGFLAPLVGRLELSGARAAVIGAGGAARAAAYALASRGALVTLYARQPERASEAASSVGVDSGVLPPPAGSWDLLVNATPVGAASAAGERAAPGVTLDGRLVYDLVYNPQRTRLLADAEAAGCETLGGLEMLVEQGRQQFAWWTGHMPEVGLFLAAARAGLAAISTTPET